MARVTAEIPKISDYEAATTLEGLRKGQETLIREAAEMGILPEHTATHIGLAILIVLGWMLAAQ